MNPKLLEIVACSCCLAKLRYDEENQCFICPVEQISYPIKNGVPILIAEKSELIKIQQ